MCYWRQEFEDSGSESDGGDSKSDESRHDSSSSEAESPNTSRTKSSEDTTEVRSHRGGSDDEDDNKSGSDRSALAVVDHFKLSADCFTQYIWNMHHFKFRVSALVFVNIC